MRSVSGAVPDVQEVIGNIAQLPLGGQNWKACSRERTAGDPTVPATKGSGAGSASSEACGSQEKMKQDMSQSQNIEHGAPAWTESSSGQGPGQS